MKKFLLLQIRNNDDPMRHQEIACFASALNCHPDQIRIFDLLSGVPTLECLSRVDVVLLGGSGDYSVAEGGEWLPPALESMRELYEVGKPTFASCWGFQAMARALGGEVVTDVNRAELGTVQVTLTEAGRRDPVFRELGDTFPAAMGHQDCVDRLPPDAVRLASSEKVQNQAFRVPDKPIYCTQFHPELTKEELIERIVAYPQYVERIAGEPVDEFIQKLCTTRRANSLLNRFLEEVGRVDPIRLSES